MAVGLCYLTGFGGVGGGRLLEPGGDLALRLAELAPMLHGDSPYPGYAYPPLTAFLFLPFAQFSSLSVIYTLLLIVSIPASLLLLGVRDWRCHLVAFCWPPVIHAVDTGNVTLLLLLGSSVAWRWRDSAAKAGTAAAFTIAAKLIAFPLVLWLASRRSWRAAVVSLCGAVTISLLLWAPFRFEGLTGYPAFLHRLDEQYAPRGYAVETLLLQSNVPGALAALGGLLVGVGVLVGCVTLGRRGDDRRSFALALVAMVVCSPIVWLHSFALLLGTVGVTRPGLSAAWIVPVLMFVVVRTGVGHGTYAQLGLSLLIAAITVTLALTRSRRPDQTAMMAPRPSPATSAGVSRGSETR